MSSDALNRLLSAVNDFDASDLHLIAGVPPAFRVNGEIIIADEDALTEQQVDAAARLPGGQDNGDPLPLPT